MPTASEKISDMSGETIYLSWDDNSQLVMVDKDGNDVGDFFVRKNKDLKFSMVGQFTMSGFSKLGDDDQPWPCGSDNTPYPFVANSSGSGEWSEATGMFTSSEDGILDTTIADGNGSAGHYSWNIAQPGSGTSHDPSMEIESA